MRRRTGAWTGGLVALLATAAPDARAAEDETPVRVAPEIGGVLIAATSTVHLNDLRYGAVAAGFARHRHESFVAHDTIRPPHDAERLLVRARRFLDDARRYRRRGKLKAAARAGDQAVSLFERCANESQHLELLVQALSERGASAVALEDPAKAETVFLSAIALDSLHTLDEVLFDEETRELYGEVRRASRQLEYGSVRVEVEDVPQASVAVDFSPPRDPPYEAKLADGRHFISVNAPGRYEVVAVVPVRAGRKTQVYLRPPPSGDASARSAALAGFRPTDPPSIAALSAAAGLRFVAVTDAGRSNVAITIHDGRTGQPVPGAQATLSVQPSPAEIDAAVGQMLDQIKVFDPQIDASLSEESPWYASWWAISLLGVAVAGAATATVLVLTTGGETEYRFEP